MAQKLDSVSCGNSYTNAATISDIYGCPGGYFSVISNDAYIQVQYGERGSEQWSDEFHATVGNGQFSPGTIGVRFRNYVAGSAAVISAGLFYPKQPWFALSAGGNATPAAATVVTGVIPAAGTTPTGGTGFTYTHTNGSGVYVFTFTTAFAAAPTVVATNADASRGQIAITAGPSTTGFSVTTAATGGVAGDRAFTFIATATV